MSELDRLNKFLAHAGVGSRRQCDEMIRAGRITLDGIVVESLGTRVAAGQTVAIDGKPIGLEETVYWLVHKPKGYICTNHDPSGRPRALDLVDHVPQRVYTVGRLDEESEGLLLLTNDGELAFKLTHPSYGIEKTYEVLVAGHPTPEDLSRLTDGIWLSDGKARANHVKFLETQGESQWIKVILAEGKNREIRRMLAKLGHKVLELKRVAIGPIWLDRLPKGKSRRLKPHEIEGLKESIDNARKAYNRRGKGTGDMGSGETDLARFDEPAGESRPRRPRPEGPGGPPMRSRSGPGGPGRRPGPPREFSERGAPGRDFGERRFQGPGRGDDEGPRPFRSGPPRSRGDGPPRGRGDGPPRFRGDGPPRGRGDGPPRSRGDGPPRGRGDGPPRPRGDGPPRPRGERPPGGEAFGDRPRGRPRGEGRGFRGNDEGGPPRSRGASGERFEERGFRGGRGPRRPDDRVGYSRRPPMDRGGPPKGDPMAREIGKKQRKGGKPAFRRKPKEDGE